MKELLATSGRSLKKTTSVPNINQVRTDSGTLVVIDKSSLCGGSGFPFSLSEWSLTICLTPCNRKYNVLSCVVK